MQNLRSIGSMVQSWFNYWDEPVKLVVFERDGKRGVGILEQGDRIRPYRLTEPEASQGLLTAIEAKQSGRILPLADVTIAAEGVKLIAPIPRPRRNIFCVGKNYYEHAHEFARSGFDSSAASG